MTIRYYCSGLTCIQRLSKIHVNSPFQLLITSLRQCLNLFLIQHLAPETVLAFPKQALLEHILAQFVKKPARVTFLLAHPVHLVEEKWGPGI